MSPLKMTQYSTVCFDHQKEKANVTHGAPLKKNQVSIFCIKTTQVMTEI